ncbi:MAG: hypothetical protein JWN44_1922 [Myxococcales bacterium]|nr:hypothetical protein [Myxococcales bacterium]
MATKMTKSTIVKSATKENAKTSAPKVSRTRKSDEPTQMQATQLEYEQVAARAYERFCARGFQHGHDVEDWLAAEDDLKS